MTQPEINTTEGESEIVRVPSHVPGLDAILCGGFLQGGLYMFQGLPGTGKTLLANQILYSHAAAGGRGLFVTVLGESHGRMLLHLETMRFFDRSVIPDKVAYISAYQALDDEGLKGLSNLIRREVLARKTTLLVLDGVSAVESRAENGFEMKRFAYEMQTLASATGCTMFLLTTTEAMSAPERTMVDGLIELRQQRQGSRNERRLLVQKIRGTGFLEGEHAFHITGDGLTVFPRIEALFTSPSRDVRRRSRRRHHDRAGGPLGRRQDHFGPALPICLERRRAGPAVWLLRIAGAPTAQSRDDGFRPRRRRAAERRGAALASHGRIHFGRAGPSAARCRAETRGETPGHRRCVRLSAGYARAGAHRALLVRTFA
jgi:KaiC/GvpD/RAD55 family RecA-like ATPase